MTSSRARVAANGLRSRTIFFRPATDPSVGRRSVRNDLVSVFSHPFLVFGEMPGDLRLPAELLDVFQRRRLARKTSELGRFGAIVLDIRHLLDLSVAVGNARGSFIQPARTGASGARSRQGRGRRRLVVSIGAMIAGRLYKIDHKQICFSRALRSWNRRPRTARGAPPF